MLPGVRKCFNDKPLCLHEFCRNQPIAYIAGADCTALPRSFSRRRPLPHSLYYDLNYVLPVDLPVESPALAVLASNELVGLGRVGGLEFDRIDIWR